MSYGGKKSGPFSGQQIASKSSSNFPTFFLIKRVSTSDESFHSVSPFLVEKAITGSIGDVKSTKKLRSGLDRSTATCWSKFSLENNLNK
ncbi:hypothetical protein AVEN_82641-1 [Araneus ventricosus]|uniref:Uncharacterized protein n=1 Tax=Araneus ventricosus TaxID=182803 RepID=A0A4Y2R2R6_ARAVE|nr:hypothetical protein AVEN_82641-1 [Araneus ventricosus]